MNYDHHPELDPPERQTCDSCSKPTVGPIEWDGEGDANWIIVTDKRDDTTRYFCSKACVYEWAA